HALGAAIAPGTAGVSSTKSSTSRFRKRYGRNSDQCDHNHSCHEFCCIHDKGPFYRSRRSIQIPATSLTDMATRSPIGLLKTPISLFCSCRLFGLSGLVGCSRTSIFLIDTSFKRSDRGCPLLRAPFSPARPRARRDALLSQATTDLNVPSTLARFLSGMGT